MTDKSYYVSLRNSDLPSGLMVGIHGDRARFADSRPVYMRLLDLQRPFLPRSGLILGFETRNQLEERGGKISIAAHCVCCFATERM